MLKTFIKFIEEQNLFSRDTPVMAAVSGGMDSVALAYLLHNGGFNFAIAHCNFGLRGEESDQDEVFVKKLARKYKVPFFVNHFNTLEFANSEKISVQMAARQLRYGWFQDLLRKYNYEKVVTAHHSNDVAETVLLNLIRGTGIAGLHGIKPESGQICRPLLFAGKQDIMQLMEENQLSWREDSSNENTKYQRNYIRHELIPAIEKINPNFRQTIQQTVEKISAVENVFEEAMDQLRSRILVSENKKVKIKISLLQNEREPVIKLFELIRFGNFTYSQCKDIIAALDSEPGKEFMSPTNVLVKDRKELIIEPRDLTEFSPLLIEDGTEFLETSTLQFKFSIEDASGYELKSPPNIASLDLHKLKFPLEIRKWKEGDWFIPLGLNHKKKLSDFFIDKKVPLIDKKNKLVLVSDGAIAWVVGERVDNRFKVTEKSKVILRITVRDKN